MHFKNEKNIFSIIFKCYFSCKLFSGTYPPRNKFSQSEFSYCTSIYSSSYALCISLFINRMIVKRRRGLKKAGFILLLTVHFPFTENGRTEQKYYGRNRRKFWCIDNFVYLHKQFLEMKTKKIPAFFSFSFKSNILLDVVYKLLLPLINS